MQNGVPIEEIFQNPSMEYGPAPFWFLNNDLQEEDVDWFLRELSEKHNSGVFLHPRTGLEIDYLTEEFWKKIAYCIETCRKYGLKAWLYDEYNWPSGVAGGKLLREHPEFIQRYLDYKRERVEKGKTVRIPVEGELVAAVAVNEKENKVIPLDDRISGSQLEVQRELEGWSVAVFTVKTNQDIFFSTTCAPWAGNETGYLDLLNRNAVRCFIEYTHEEYRKRFKDDFGDLIPGVFTDEPANYRGLPWTDGFLEEFRKRKGYDLSEKIHELAFNMGDYVKTRCDYFEVASQLFSEAFYGQIGAWCRKNGLVFTGHLLLEEDLDTLPCYHGNVYTALREMDMPGIDWLGEKTGYEESALAETPDLAPKTASSIAHATGRRFVLCEYGGGSGWGTTLASLKNLVNYLQATGVNFMNHHAAHLSLKGLRKRDFPPSHFVQEPWWKFYRVFSDYIARLSYINSQGTHVADVLLLYPVRSIWAEYTLRGKSDVFERVIKLFGMISNALLRIQRDYDLLFEDEVLEGMVSVGDNCLEIADERFRVLILPPMTTIPVKVIELVRNFFEGGGVVVCLGFPPTNSDEREDDPVVEAHVRAIFSEAVFQRKRASNSNAKGGQAVFVPLPRDVDREELEKILRNTLNQLVESDIEVDSPKSRNLIYLHRRIEGDEFYFLANLSEEKVEGEITLNAWGRLEKWDPETGEITPVYVYRRKEGKTIIPYCFEPYEGVYFVVKRGKEQRHATQSNVTITGIYETAQKITGYSRVSDPKVMFEGARLTEKTQQILEPITVSKWSVEIPTNYMVLEPWTIRVLDESKEPEDEENKNEEKQLPVSRYTSIEELTSQINQFAEFLGIDRREYGLYEVLDILVEKAREMGIDIATQSIPFGGSYEMTTEIEVKHVPDQILLVYEDLGEPFEVYINKSRVEETPQVFFLWDRSNRALNIKNYLKKGKNQITIKTRYPDFRDKIPSTHGIEPVVLVGKFAVKEQKIEEPKFKALEKAEKESGFPYYSGDITLRQKINLEEEYLERKLMLECTGFRDAVTIRVNGKEAGTRLWPPYRVDITELVQKGENELEIIITNTAENLLGTPKPLEEVKATIIPYNKHLFNY
nr:glycosyl hydrolase [Candidatus Freyarchaeota archaeon]